MATQTTNSFSSLVQSLGEFPPDSVVFGKSEAMQALRARMNKVASANVPVLIQGESGTGKDIIARMIHALSPWKSGPWVKVNCPAIPGTLLESELFGYEKGAFTGAYGSKPGRVELAHRGTLFLDEISELDLSLQSKLLQLLQDGQFCRIGAQEDKKVEVRVVCATNRKLEDEIARIMIDASAGPTHRLSRYFDNIMVKVTVQDFHVWTRRRPLFFSLQQFGESRIQSFQSKNEISPIMTVDISLSLTRQSPQHFVLS